MVRTLAVVAVVAVLGVTVFASDPKADALKHIDQGRAALVEDKARQAIDHLQKAINFIQKTLVKGFVAFLPNVWEDWEATEPKTEAGSWGTGAAAFQWMQAERSYIRKSDKLKVNVSITNMPQLTASYRAMIQGLKNPMVREMMKKDPSTQTEIIEKDGWLGLFQVHDGKRSEATAMHEKVAVIIRFRAADMALLKRFFDAVDRLGIAAAARK
jgi:hypothetical protein